MGLVKVIGLGTSISVVPTSGGAGITIAGLIDLNGPGTAGSKIDTTTLDTTDNFGTFQVGTVDPGEITMTLAYGSTETSQIHLAELLKNRQSTTFAITYPSTATPAESFVAYVNGMGRTIQKDQMTQRDVTLLLTGDPGWPSS